MTPVLDLLTSYAFNQSTDLGELREAIGPDALLLIDSGAYTAHTTGREVTLDGYAKFLRRWEGTYTSAITLDVIGDPVATKRNTVELRDRGFNVMPVFTVGAPLGDLDEYADEYGYIAVGGLVGQRMNENTGRYRQMVCDRARRHGAGIHFLGVSTPRLMMSAKPYSCDVSTPTQCRLRGRVMLWDGKKIIQFLMSDRASCAKHRELIAGYGLSLRTLLSGEALTSAYRPQLHTANMLAAMAAAAAIRRYTESVPVPRDVKHALPGPRRATALVASDDVKIAITLARRLATGDVPPLFRRHTEALGEPVPA